jgi:ribonuclease HI
MRSCAWEGWGTSVAETVVVAHFDGLCETFKGRRNPGGCACSGWVVDPYLQGSIPIPLRSGHRVICVGEGATNNVAEYHAALDALRAIYKDGWRGRVLLRGDSQLVVRQYSGEYGVNAALLIPLYTHLKMVAVSFFSSVRLEWVPREANEAADAQSRIAYDAYRRRHGR